MKKFIQVTLWSGHNRDDALVHAIDVDLIMHMIDNCGNQPRATRIWLRDPLIAGFSSQHIDVNETLDDIIAQIEPPPAKNRKRGTEAPGASTLPPS